MQVLILGGYGFIGLEAARRLIGAHSVTALGRNTAHGKRVLPEATWLHADIAVHDTPEKWAPLLAGVDVVVNASGALQDGARDNVAAVQDIAIRALIRACEAAGIRRFVQISAPGVAGEGAPAFLRTKAAADDALARSSLDWVILRPGLVWGRTASGGTALVRMLSVFPLVQPLILASARVQMVDIEDVVDAIVRAVDGRTPARTDTDLVEASPRTLAEIIAAVRHWHGAKPPLSIITAPPFIGALIARFADLAGWLGWRSPLRTTSLRALERGVVGTPPSPSLTSFDEALRRRPATRQDRVFARTQLLLPLIVLCLSAFWIVSGVIGLMQKNAAVTVLPPHIASVETLVVGGAIADIALGLALLWRPWARAACFGMIALTLGYLLAGTWLTPQLWTDPLGPFVKTLPAALLALVCAGLLEER
jgi:nucleoside-diphosphate-sugar epimerase/uncharacterized membrane protein